MKPILRALVALAAVVTVSAAPLAAQSAATTVIVVRHAEKEAEPAADPALTAAGVQRADALAEAIKDAGVQAVMSTAFKRTQLTAAPAARLFGLTVETVDARAPNHPKAVADAILAQHRGRTVLVVGHSNTVPAIVAALGAAMPPAICDAQYDNLFIVTIPAAGKPGVVKAKFGEKSGSC